NQRVRQWPVWLGTFPHVHRLWSEFVDAGGGDRNVRENTARQVLSGPGRAGPVRNRSGVGCPVRSQPGGASRGGRSRWNPVSATGGDVDQPQPGGDATVGPCEEVAVARRQSDLDP